MKVTEVMERVYARERLYRAWLQVRRNAGAAGIDQMTVEAFAEREEELLNLIHERLKVGEYRFKPARRVLIPKPGSTKKRKLGIPVVMDRVVSQSLQGVLSEIFEPDFSDSNFGFRRGRSPHQAIRHMQRAVLDGFEWGISVDLENFFDTIPHGLIFKLIRRKISDERVVTLIARALKSGVWLDGKVEKSDRGCPQGSPVSPVLSNIALNELDRELDRRGHRFCRWADDFVIMVGSERAALRVSESVVGFLEQELGLSVNRDKSRVAPVSELEFLGFQIRSGKICVSNGSSLRFKKTVRLLTRRNNGYSMYQVLYRLNEYLRGWVGYFRIQELRGPFKKLDQIIRYRLRSMQLKKWKRPKKFQRMMIRRGFSVHVARDTWVRMRKWSSASRREVCLVLSNRWFRQQRLLFLDDYIQRNLKLPFAC